MANDQRRDRQSLRESSQQQNKGKALEDWQKMAIRVLFAIPVITVLLYALGWFEYGGKYIDDKVIAAIAVGFGIGGWLLLEFIMDMFKVKGD